MIAPMIEKGIEVILGAKIDPVFGPFIVFGLGGIYAEAIKDLSAFVDRDSLPEGATAFDGWS